MGVDSNFSDSNTLVLGPLGDASLTRVGPGVIAVGNGKAGDASGNFRSSGSVLVPTILSGTTDAVTAVSGTYVITTGSADGIVLAAPAATTDDGKILTFVSSTAFAHTITSTGSKFLTGSSGKVHVITMSATAGSSIRIIAYNGSWLLLENQGCTLTS